MLASTFVKELNPKFSTPLSPTPYHYIENKMNRVGASTHPCLKPLETLILAKFPSMEIPACMLSCRDLITLIKISGTPCLARTSHVAALGTESYAFFKPIKKIKAFVSCSIVFSTNWRAQISCLCNHDCTKNHTENLLPLSPQLSVNIAELL